MPLLLQILQGHLQWHWTRVLICRGRYSVPCISEGYIDRFFGFPGSDVAIRLMLPPESQMDLN